MTDDRSVHPDILLESVLRVPSLVQPTLGRLGIVTVGQMAALDVLRLPRQRAVGSKKRKILASLAAAAVEALRVRGRPSNPTKSEFRTGGRSGGHQENLPPVPGTQKNLRNRRGIRAVQDELAVDLDTPDNAAPLQKIQRDSTGCAPKIPLFFVPTILKNQIFDLHVRHIDDLNSVDVWELEDRRGWGDRKTGALIELRELYQALLSGPKSADDSCRLSEVAGAEALFYCDICSLTIGEITESSAEWMGLSGSAAADYTGLRVLLLLARLQCRDRGETPADVISCLSPKIDRTFGWQEIPLNLPSRGRNFLDRLRVKTLGEVDRLAVTGQFCNSETGEYHSATGNHGVTPYTLQAIRTELLLLSLLGLDGYRYRDAGKPVTCSEVVARLREITNESHFEILRDRSSGGRLRTMAERWKVTHERVRQIEQSVVNRARHLRIAAAEILEPLHSQLRCHRMILLTEVLKLVGAASLSELYMTAAIAGNPIHWISPVQFCSLASSADRRVKRSQLSQWIIQTDDGDLAAVRPKPSQESHQKTVHGPTGLR